ncbi:hypothetical protein AKJ65_04570 [candidate division MSBL1 archaeon SCGC-AAA259E19]|uniref:Uncharacterized protein n=1 Tax=candidate division MSBL1 archaeon SCGC-AAA259E19 TaxID=1698264 RepID=A0A133UJL4_9EURY|nr:hypothetical protein AKJ65_04570 [candidate division MSBL1 archaeon SCGC-AAA259E19]
MRPVYHGRDDRIREHCFLMYLLIVIHRYLMERLREPVLEEFEIGEETIHRLLKELRLITSKPSDTNKPEFVVEDKGAIENAVIQCLDLERFIPETDRHEL